MTHQQKLPHPIDDPKPFSSPVPIIISGRALEDLVALRTLTLGASDVEIVQEALAAYRAELAYPEVEP